MAAYLVLARKYRPQGFSDMTGQEHVVQTLSNAMKSGRVAHALLFCGPRGCGKTTTARIVAKALNCVNGPTPEPCGVCTPCREITAGTDVDVQEIDAASNTGVDNVRELRESAKYLPARDRYKIFIVDEVHMLSKAAFNAFLKTLEEPPGHVKFLFATTDPQALPDTILSRCQRHNFRLVPLKQIVERIRSIAKSENVTIDDGAVALVARQAAGSMRDALSILDQLFSSCDPGAPITEALAAQALGALDRTVISDLAGALLAKDARGVLTAVSRAHDGGHDLKRLTEDLATHLRNLVAASVAGAPLDLPDHELRSLREQSAQTDAAELARLFELVHGSLTEMSKAAQPRHALEIALLRAIHLAPAASVQSLLARADELARRLGGGGDAGPPGGGGGGRPVPSARPRFEAGPPAPERFQAAPAAPVAAAPATFAPQAAPVAFAPSAAPAAIPAPPPPAPERPAAFAQSAPAGSMPSQAATATAHAAPAFQQAPLVAPPAPAPAPAPPAAKAATPAQPPGNRWERHLSLVPGAEGAAAASAPAPNSPVVSTAFTAPVAAEPQARPPAPSPMPEAARPPPAPAQEPSAWPVDAALEARWPQLVETIRGRKKVLGTALEHARPLQLSNGELVLGFVRGQIHAQNVATEQATLEALLAEALGSATRLKLVELGANEVSRTASIAEGNERAERESREARLRGGREHAAILRAVSILGAELEDVRDLGGQSS